MKSTPLSISKNLDMKGMHQTLETHWWIHNNVHPCQWSKYGSTYKKDKIEKFIQTWLHEPFSKEYEYRKKRNPLVLTDSYHVLKDPSDAISHKMSVYIGYGIEIRDEINLDFRVFWDPSVEYLAEKFIRGLSELCITDTEKTQVYMVVQDSGGLDLRSFDINIPDLDIELNYGTEWKEKHEYLLEVLSRETKKGIALLHGLPGTGKSMYIRYLISLLAEERTLIYLPNQLIPSITDPGFLPLMADYPNSILIIEDAEEAIKSRKTGGATVDKLLNLSDGIISDFLGTQIICTFNSDITTIDEALLRKGRLILKHEFKRLSIEQAQALADKLGITEKITKEMTLSEVYNIKEKYSEEVKETRPIGFR